MTGATPFRYIAGAYIHDMTVDVTIKGDDVDLSGCGYDYEATLFLR